MSEELERRLAALARDLRVDVPVGLEARVVERVRREAPAAGRVRSRAVSRRVRGWLVGLVVVLVGAGAAASPVGASVRQWLAFHGVSVLEDGPAVSERPTVPAEPAAADVTRAARLAGFSPLVPASLGPPDGVSVSPDGVVVSMSWGSGDDTVRLDQFRGSVEPLFWKVVEDGRHVALADGEALWLPTAHHVTVVTADGDTRRLESRLAAPTLVWTRGPLTLRLEGDLTVERARDVAESTG